MNESPRITWARACIEARNKHLREVPEIDSEFLETIAINAWEDGRAWMINNPCPGFSAAQTGHGNAEDLYVAQSDHLNCPTCGGSGHVADATCSLRGAQKESGCQGGNCAHASDCAIHCSDDPQPCDCAAARTSGGVTDSQLQSLWNEACRDSPQAPGWNRHLRYGRAVAALSTHHAAPGAPQKAEPLDVLVAASGLLCSGRFPVMASTVPVGSELHPFLRELLAIFFDSRPAAAAPNMPKDFKAQCLEWERNGELLERAWQTMYEQEQRIIALETAAPAGGVTPQGELDPRTALEHARSMTRYVQSFNGQTFSPALDSVDRQNLATALDNLEETAVMLLNMADRAALQAARAAEPATLPDLPTEAMCEAAMEAHYGKQRVRACGGARGIDMTVNGNGYDGIQAFRRMWKGALSVLAASPTPPTTKDGGRES